MSKLQGITRTMDTLGRIVIPKEIRDKQGWPIGTEFEIDTTAEGVLFKPVAIPNQCTVCGNRKKLVRVFERCLCKGCLDEANKGKLAEVELY